MIATDSKDWQFFAKSFVAGGLAGMTSKTTVAPLDRIKILLQVHNSHYKNFGVFSGLLAIVRQESFLSLYKGNGAQMVRIFPYAAIQFMSFEGYKRALAGVMPPTNGKVNHGSKFVAGSMAGVTSVLFTYPLDLVRARLASVVLTKSELASVQIQALKSLNVVGVATGGAGVGGGTMTITAPTTIVGTIGHVFRYEGGVQGLYRGITPTVLAMIPYGGCNFYMFERLKYLCCQYAPKIFCRRPSGPQDDKLVLNVPAKLMCGGIAGAIGQTAIYPLDVARRRMQLSMTSTETRIYSQSFLRTLLVTYRSHGISGGLYRGMSVNYVRAIPMVAVSFCTYELLKQLLGMETGV